MAQQILKVAIDYALYHNLPLPHSVYRQHLYKGRLPDWIANHLDNPEAEHHAYYKFAIEEYSKVYSILLVGSVDTDIQFPYGQLLLEKWRNSLQRERGTGKGTSSLAEFGSW